MIILNVDCISKKNVNLAKNAWCMQYGVSRWQICSQNIVVDISQAKNQLFHNRRWLLTKKYSYADRNNMKFNVALYQACSSVNCKFVISLSPFFISFSFRGLYRHYREYTFHHVLFPCERRISTTESNNVCLV